MGRQGDAEQVARFPVKVGPIGLGPCEQADRELAQTAQGFTEDAQSGAFAHAGIAQGQGKAALPDLLLDVPAEALDWGQSEQRGRGDLG